MTKKVIIAITYTLFAISIFANGFDMFWIGYMRISKHGPIKNEKNTKKFILIHQISLIIMITTGIMMFLISWWHYIKYKQNKWTIAARISHIFLIITHIINLYVITMKYQNNNDTFKLDIISFQISAFSWFVAATPMLYI